MLRRTMTLGLGCGVLAACVNVPPPPNGDKPLSQPANAPPPQKIQRLLVWIPPPQAAEIKTSSGARKAPIFSGERFAAELKQQLELHGVEVAVGTSSGFELDRRDEQKALAGRLKPTHRLEVDVGNTYASQYATFGQMRWVLYNAGGTQPVRSRSVAITPNRDDSVALADDAAKRLEAEGFL
jgi:hypothetical protein